VGGDAALPVSPLLAVPNVTAHPLTANVPVTVVLYTVFIMVRCSAGFNVAVKGLKDRYTIGSQRLAENWSAITARRLREQLG